MAKSSALIKREAAEARRRATPYRRPTRVHVQKSVTSIPFDEHAAEMIARVVGTELGELRKDLVEQVAALSARLGRLELQPALRWAGTWRHGTPTGVNSMITHLGSLWLCVANTDGTVRPGSDPNCFRLIVKSGRAGH